MKKKIDFFCVGVQKAGTSTLHEILIQHPDINLPIHKETHFFSDTSRYNKGLGYYFSHYFKSKQSKIIGEIDPEYSYFPDCANRIKTEFGNVKIILLLRDPVERAYSHYLMTRRRGIEVLPFFEAIEKEKERLKSYYEHFHFSYISRGLYFNQIKRFTDVFGKENVKVLFFNDFLDNKKDNIETICKFINLPPYNFNFEIKSNPASEPKSAIIRDFIYRPNFLKKFFGKIIFSKKLRSKIMHFLNKKNLKPSKTNRLDIDEKSLIYNNYFKKEVERIEKLLEVDLSNWKHG